MLDVGASAVGAGLLLMHKDFMKALVSRDVFDFDKTVGDAEEHGRPQQHSSDPLVSEMSAPAARSAQASISLSGADLSPIEMPELPDDFPVFFFGTNRNDRANGGRGADLLFGEGGNDKLYGRGGDDYLDGGRGVDALYGGSGGDYLDGGGGNDVLWGGSGRDVLIGGAGDDTFYGGRGADFFVLDSKVGRDVIKDFSGSDQVVIFRSSGDFTGVRRRDVEIVDKGKYDLLYIQNDVVARIEGDLSMNELLFA